MEFPWHTIAAIIVIISPFDILPDFISVTGHLDELTILY
ncbi:MAG: DUF1232 domain-containing protein [Thermodesulfovibrio sp.]